MATESDRLDPDDPLPDGTEHVVVLHREILISDGTPTPERYTAGTELPLDVARSCWSAHGDRLAAFDASGKRLDQPSRAERLTVGGAESFDADAAIGEWRERVGLRTSERTVWACDECDRTFATATERDAHMADHSSTDATYVDAEGDGSAADGPDETGDDGPTFDCGLCSRSFGSQNALNAHRGKAHADADRLDATEGDA